MIYTFFMRYLIVCFISCFFWAESFGQELNQNVRKEKQELLSIDIGLVLFNCKDLKMQSFINNKTTECKLGVISVNLLYSEKSAYWQFQQNLATSIRGARPDANIVLIDGIRAMEYENAFIPFDEGQSVKVKTH